MMQERSYCQYSSAGNDNDMLLEHDWLVADSDTVVLSSDVAAVMFTAVPLQLSEFTTAHTTIVS